MSRNRHPLAPRARRRHTCSAGPFRASRLTLRARKGVILLVILALLALFTLLGLTLVMATAQARRNALASARSNAQAMRDDAPMDEVFNQVARGSNDTNSALQGHGLLEDLYGQPLLLGSVSAAPIPMAAGQAFSMQVAATAVPATNGVMTIGGLASVAPAAMFQAGNPASGEYCGLVITMLNGIAQGRSARIIGHAYDPNTGLTTLEVTAFDGLIPGLNDQFLINGRPFSGTGFGFNPAAIATLPITLNPLLSDAEVSPIAPPVGGGLPLWYFALLPNHAAFTLGGLTGTYLDPAGPGGANESYDAPDFQNMVLAMHYYDANVGSPTLNTVVTPLPSLHRPDLIQYWMSAYGSPSWALFAAGNPDLARRICLRPLPTDHPAFTGGNTSPGGFDAILPAIPGSGFFWDVDNDGDGVPDSIWVDAGLDVQTASDGTKFKYLAAILCVDMDGKININANGMLTHLDPDRYGANIVDPLNGNNMYGPFAGPIATGPTGASQVSVVGSVAAPNVDSRLLSLGQGTGPWETNPLYLFMRNALVNGGATPAVAQAQAFNDLLFMWQGFVDISSGTAIYYDGSYGESQRTGLLVPTNNPSGVGVGATVWQRILGGPRPGLSRWYDVVAGVDYPHDVFALTREMGVRPYLLTPANPLNAPGTFFDFISPFYSVTLNPFASPATHVPSSYGSPYDYHGRGVMGVDIAGHIFYAGTPALSATGSNFWTTVQLDPSAAGAPLNDMPDHPGELDLSPNARHDGWIDPVTGTRVTIDQPFGPDELSHVLRPTDADMMNSPSRLKHLADLSNSYPILSTAPGTASAWPLQNSQRWSLTTESRHLPVPDTAAPDLTATYSAQQDLTTFSTVTGRPLRYNSLSIVDLMRARIIAVNGAPPPVGAGNGLYTLANSPDLALFGNVNGNPAATAAGVQAVWPLLAPELIQGLKLDINRLLGNGQDDLDPITGIVNGVVDDPNEVFSGEIAAFPTVLGTVVTQALDLNNDGIYPLTTDGTNADYRARQLLARQLYVLMMLLVDDRYLQASIFNPAATPLVGNWPLYGALLPREQAAYVIAQWAINAVDFRDADSIMTPFEFDLHPFFDDDGNPANGTWDVDDVVYPASGVVYPANTQATAADDNPLLRPWRGIVFGAERPALLLTETLATHDRGTDDTNLAAAFAGPTPPAGTTDTYTNDMTNPDPDFDQVRRPRGSLMVEVFNPNGFMDAPRNDLLFDAGLPALGLPQPWASGLTGVNLGQTTYNGAGLASSVWRLAVVYSPLAYGAHDLGYTGVPAPVLDPRVPVLNPATIHRVAYLGTSVNAANDMVAAAAALNPLLEVPVNRSFYVDQTITGVATPLIVAPDSYAIIGNGTLDPTTSAVGMYIGARAGGGRSMNQVPGNLNSSTPMHMLLWGTPGVYTGAGPGIGPYAAAGNIKAVLGVPLATSLFAAPANTPATPQLLQTDHADAQWTLRFSLSEPESGYPDWPTPNGAAIYPNLDDQFFYQDYPAATAPNKWPNHPWDSPNYTQNAPFSLASPPAAAPATITPSSQSTPNPNIAANGAAVNTIGGYTTIYLQRLANPLAPWDAFANPYITVDSMDVSLTSYTGEASPPSGGASGGIEPSYGAAIGGGGGVAAFDNLARGELTSVGITADAPNVWTPLPSMASGMQQPPAGGSITAPLPNQTFGYLNPGYYGPAAINNPAMWAAGMYNAASAAVASTPAGVNSASYTGDPIVPFPWLAWNDRPYVSQYELMLVPASGPSALLGDVGLLGWAAGGGASNQFKSVQQAPLGPLPQGSLPFAQFQHLLNFFDDAAPAPFGVVVPGKSDIARLYRAFDYIAVPSRFAGTQEMLTPAAFAISTSPYTAYPGSSPAWAQLYPPFNWLNQYREPGRVNLNTVYDPQVFQGVMDDYPGWLALWNNLIGSRRGYGGSGGSLYAATPAYPTIFANPFRAAGTSALVPPLGLATPALMMPVDNPTVPTLMHDVNSTMLRAASSWPGGTLGGSTAMFDANSFDSTNTSANYIFGSGTVPSRESGRNPAFEYAPETRLGNLTTNHSNVYAIWITLGKFQVTSGPVNATHPDGYYLGAEVTDAVGNTVRPKSFYIYDRSIPVGFMRGENLNMEKGVLIERVLQ